MKKNGEELKRLKNVIESDRLQVTNNFNDLLISDLTKVLKDYFDLKGSVEVSIGKEGSKYLIDIKCTSTRIKTFGIIPR